MDAKNEEKNIVEIVNELKNADTMKPIDQFNNKTFIEKVKKMAKVLGKKIPVVSEILDVYASENYEYKFKKIIEAIEYLETKLNEIENEKSKESAIKYINENPDLINELFEVTIKTTDKNSIKYKYWANYIVNIAKNHESITFEEIEVFDKIIKDLVELDYVIIDDLYKNDLIVGNKLYVDPAPYGIGKYDIHDFFRRTDLKGLKEETLHFRVKKLISHGIIDDGIFEDVKTKKAAAAILLTELGKHYYEYVINKL